MKKAVAIIGLGAMGRGIGENLRQRGHEVIGCDRDEKIVETLRGEGWTLSDDALDAARQASHTICMVANTAQTETVLGGPAGLIANVAPGHIVICMNTIDPLAAVALEKDARARGVGFLDAPVSGGRDSAYSGKLSMMIGGDNATYQQCAGLLGDIAAKQFYIGEAGQGMAMKHVNNMLTEINIVAMCEALVLGVKAGIDPKTIYDVVSASSGSSYIFEKRAPRILARNFDKGGTIDICYKDQELQTAFGKSLNVPLFVAAVTQQVFQMARAAGLGSEDAGTLIKVLEKQAGVIVGKEAS